VAQNATETSHADEVAAVMPMIRRHRYAPFIESYGVNWRTELRRFYAILGDVQSVDPRGNMERMFHLTWNAYDEDGKPQRGEMEAKYAFKSHDATLPALVEAYDRVSYSCWNDMDQAAREALVGEFSQVSRHCPYVLRTKMVLVDKPSGEQLAEWESTAGNDPVALTRLGNFYYDAEKYSDAARCYERAVELSPSAQRHISLAKSYRKAGKEELWLPTLERYLAEEDLGLGHSQIHWEIADDLISKGQWEEAEPHAVQCAQTYSAGGLALASNVYEGLGRWLESEHWAREATRCYPSYSGYVWYFWCLRTGRGDAEQARQAADAYFKMDGVDRSEQGRGQMFVAGACQDKPQEALEHMKTLAKMCLEPPNGWIDRSYAQIHLALVAGELEDHDTQRSAITELRRIVDEEILPKDADFAAVNEMILNVLTGELPSEASLADYDERLEKLDKAQRCDYEYFMGRVHELRGEPDVADTYYGRAVTRGPLDRHNATLAGYYLSKRHGTSRP
jgi:tetratricopeptide (TPR) repeat protein